MVNEKIIIKFDKGRVNYEAITLLINDIIETACSKSPVYSEKVGLPLKEFAEFYIYGKELEHMDKWGRVVIALEDIIVAGLKIKKELTEHKIDESLYENKISQYISKLYFLKTYTEENVLNAKK
jgi:hypothetical protein